MAQCVLTDLWQGKEPYFDLKVTSFLQERKYKNDTMFNLGPYYRGRGRCRFIWKFFFKTLLPF